MSLDFEIRATTMGYNYREVGGKRKRLLARCKRGGGVSDGGQPGQCAS